MPVYLAPETWEAKERWKFDHTVGETHPSDPTITGVRPSGYQHYPLALYKPAMEGGIVILTQHQAAGDEHEEARLRGNGWCLASEAAGQFKADQTDVATLAAERHYQERHMSEGAQREVAAAEAETMHHLPVLEQQPIKRRGRPRKQVAP